MIFPSYLKYFPEAFILESVNLLPPLFIFHVSHPYRSTGVTSVLNNFILLFLVILLLFQIFPNLVNVLRALVICNCVENYFRMLWGTGISDAIFFLSPDFHRLWRSVMSVCLLTEVKRQWATLVLGWVTI